MENKRIAKNIERSHEVLKHIRDEIRIAIRETLESIEKQFNTYVVVNIQNNEIKFIFHPNPDKPEYIDDIIVIKFNGEHWIVTLLGGDFLVETLYSATQLARILNKFRIKNVEQYFS